MHFVFVNAAAQRYRHNTALQALTQRALRGSRPPPPALPSSPASRAPPQRRTERRPRAPVRAPIREGTHHRQRIGTPHAIRPRAVRSYPGPQRIGARGDAVVRRGGGVGVGAGGGGGEWGRGWGWGAHRRGTRWRNGAYTNHASAVHLTTLARAAPSASAAAPSALSAARSPCDPAPSPLDPAREAPAASASRNRPRKTLISAWRKRHK